MVLFICCFLISAIFLEKLAALDVISKNRVLTFSILTYKLVLLGKENEGAALKPNIL